MKISFWSPVHGKGCTTFNLLVTSLELASRKEKVLTINGNYKTSYLEKAFVKTKNYDDIIEGIGLDVLLQNTKSGILDDKTMRYSSLSFLDDCLNIIPSSTRNHELYDVDVRTHIARILNIANVNYDFVFIDVPAGRNALSEIINDAADIIVVNLPQDIRDIDEFFNRHHLPIEKVVYLIGAYNSASKYNIKNLVRIFQPLRDKVAVIPYNINFSDAIQDSLVIRYFQKINIDKKYDSFTREVKSASDLIIKRKEVKNCRESLLME